MPEGRVVDVVDDVALLEAWSRGDRAAGTELFERHHVSVARYFQHKAPEAVQEDLIHETFLACLTAAARFRGEARFQTFLLGIAHRVLADHLRRLGRRMARLGSETDPEEIPAISLGLSPVATAVHHEERRLLLEALRRIPLIHQIALELHYWEDLTAAEISDLLGVPLGTAKTRLRDGRAYLEAQLRELARSPESPQSPLDDLDQWARRVRDQLLAPPEPPPRSPPRP